MAMHRSANISKSTAHYLHNLEHATPLLHSLNDTALCCSNSHALDHVTVVVTRYTRNIDGAQKVVLRLRAT